ncbi:extracellular solute-binding protein [Paenibacillus sp. B2(2019)]|uniref:extracellular solute-binding protein n=1 Tax=Paenibacillus sp. B2(2019) TaxID=2607754 RepID=UPI0011F12781|nr:extracellular solute-binding protein [Paenibacillus sp. B2(2019)]KAA1191426.1 extracellular solute-binding protein [Paenibacillus sp. B2(2019)]
MKGSNGQRRKGLRISGALLIVAGLLAGCGQGAENGVNSSPTANQETSKPSEPLKLSMMNMYYSAEPPKADNEAVKMIEQYTGTELDITWVPNSAYNDKINATIAAGELPQIMMIASNKGQGIINAVQSGLFWEVGPYLKDYPNLSKLNPTVLSNISVEGKVYGIFRSRPLAREGIILRKDWLDAVGLAEPKTIDEFYNVIKAFSTMDPDKNGKADTFGMYEGRGLNGFQTILGWYGGPNLFGIENDKVVPDFLTEEYMKALKLYKRLYDEKLINQDFAVVPGTKRQEAINQGKAGLIISTLDDVNAGFNDLAKANPNAVLDVVSRINGPKGERLMLFNGGYVGTFMFPKTSVKTEDELKQILGFMDKLADKDMQNLFEWGIEGKHYKVENGKPARTDGKAYETDINSIYQIRFDDGSLADAGENAPIVSKYKQMFKDNADIAVANPAESFQSPTLAEKGSEITKIIQDARVKFIMGDIDEAGWNAALEQWKKSGGDKVIEEYTAQYLQLKK